MANAADLSEAKRQLLARMLSGQGQATAAAPAPIPSRAPDATVPVTAEQSQLWLHAAMAPDMPLYNESITIHRRGSFDLGALERALSEIVRRHEIWRTSFAEENGELVQKIAPPFDLKLPLIDLTHLPEAERDAEAVRLATDDARTAIPFDQAPLFRARVMKLADDDHRLYLTLHHIIFDGVSIYRTIVPELAKLYEAFAAGRPSPLPEPKLQYGDYAVWQQQRVSDESERQLRYWRERLQAPLPRLEVMGDHPRPAAPTHAGSMEVFELSPALIDALKTLARAESATLYMVLLAAWKATLFRYTGDEDLIVGGVTDTRRRPELVGLVGYFLNTMALRTRPAADKSFRDYLAEVRTTVLGALDHCDVPFDRIVRALDIRRAGVGHPLFNTLFSIEPPVDPFPEGWDLTQMDVTVGAAKYDLYMELDERPEGGMAGRLLYGSELYDPATIRRIVGNWQVLLEGAVADPACPLGKLPLLTEDERRAFEDWNRTERPLAFETLPERFAEQAAATPDAIAVECEGVSWTYAQLDARADAIAARLEAEGVRPDMLVGIALTRSPEMVAALLGVLRAGGAYLPLDPDFPPARLQLILEDAAPALLLTERGLLGQLPKTTAKTLCAEDISGDDPPSDRAIDPASLAYVLYTSGSTGRPKGVEITHRALANLLSSMQREPGFGRQDSLVAVTTLSFDIAALEIFLPLVSGGKLVLAPRAVASDMHRLAETLDAVRPTVMQATPATWRGLVEAGWRGANNLTILCGGEALTRPLAGQLLARSKALWNMYGPTETTIWSAVHKIEPSEGPVPIGHPIDNTSIHILDRAGNPVPVGAPGELHIGGLGLARGYRGRPNLTEERFRPAEAAGGALLYRTGDLARWRPDRTLECLGRTDHEEKIRGFRIAVEEVETALARHPIVLAAAVRGWADPSGERFIAAYYVAQDGAELDVGALRQHLRESLPDYMVPARFVALEALPLTHNGKVDRNSLPAPDAAPASASAPPETADEKRLAALWCEVLRVEQVGRDDDFFDLGGHSLLVARLLRRIEADYGIRLPMAALFRAPRLSAMASLLGSGRATEGSAAILVQAQGSRPPLLWLDGGTTFRPLAKELGLDQPFTGILVDPVLEAAGGCPDRFEAAAALVVQAIREVQPRGPYYLGGWCTSGILAFAVAQQLVDAGEEVPFLALMHSTNPTHFRRIPRRTMTASKVRFHLAELMRQPGPERWRYLRARIQGLSDATALARGDEAVLQPAIRSALDRAALAYDPRSYQGDLVLIEPRERPDVLDFAPGWAEIVRGHLANHIVSGGHRSMLEPPHVAELGRVLGTELARAQGRDDERQRRAG